MPVAVQVARHPFFVPQTAHYKSHGTLRYAVAPMLAEARTHVRMYALSTAEVEVTCEKTLPRRNRQLVCHTSIEIRLENSSIKNESKTKIQIAPQKN